ncbi:hypothetical protein L0Y46_05015, partial [bacterium]|nr:hypothetical protein [bacterium]
EVINPSLVAGVLCKSLKPVTITSVGFPDAPPGTPSTPPQGGGLQCGEPVMGSSHVSNKNFLAGFNITTNRECGDPCVPTCTSLEGMEQGTLNALANLRNNCPECEIIVTGGTETGHAKGACSHESGNKVDIRPTASVVQFIETPGYCTRNGNRTGDHGGPRWMCSGVEYVRESDPDHYDITVGC